MISLLQFIETAEGDEVDESEEEELCEEEDDSQTANTLNVSDDIESFPKLTVDDRLDEGIESTRASQSLTVLSEENTSTNLVSALNVVMLEALCQLAGVLTIRFGIGL